MASILCPRCNQSLDSNNTFCGNCGYSLQVGGSATAYPPQGQPGRAYPPSYAPEPPLQQVPFPHESTTSSAPTYQTGGTLPPFSNGNTPSFTPTYPAGGTPPPPPYPVGNRPSSASYLQDGAYFAQSAYPNNAPYPYATTITAATTVTTATTEATPWQ